VDQPATTAVRPRTTRREEREEEVRVARPRLLTLAPWRRGPALLLRRPGVALALTAAAFVAALPAAAAAPFLDSAQDATLHHELAATCPWKAGVHVETGTRAGTRPTRSESGEVVRPSEDTAHIRGAMQRLAAAIPGLGDPVTTRFTPYLAVSLPATPGGAGGDDPLPVTVLTRTDFTRHVQVREGGSGPGLWLPDTLAGRYRLHAGDSVRLAVPARYRDTTGSAAPAPQPVRVAAVYTDLRALPDDPYWCSLKTTYAGEPGQEFTDRPIPPFVLIDDAVLDAVSDGWGSLLGVNLWLEYPLARPDRISTAAAARVAAGIDRMPGQLTATGLFDFSAYHGQLFTSYLSHLVRRAHLVRLGLLPPVAPITAAGTLVGLLVVAAAAVFWVQRRGHELRILAAHGVGPGGLGTKALTEALPALLVGAVAGGACAWLLVAVAGPDDRLTTQALPLAALATGVALLAACLVVRVVAGLRCRALTDQPPASRRRAGRGVPWELALLLAGAAAWRMMSGATELTDDPVSGAGAVAHVPARLLVVPILVSAGLVLLAARLVIAWLRRRSLRATPRRPAALLAWRRLGRDAVTAAVLAGATAVPIALAAYGAAVTGSVRDTAQDQARLLLGSDLVVSLAAPTPAPPALAGRASEVVRLYGASFEGVRCDVLAVDPATFMRGVAWDDRVGASLRELTTRLAAGPASVAVGSGQLRAGDGALLWANETVGQVQVVNTPLLPGSQGGYPILLVDRAMVDPALLARGLPQLWVRGDADSARAALVAAQAPVRAYGDAATIFRNTLFEPVTFTFQYLVALSLLTGVVTAVGLLLYLESRAPERRRAYVLLRRMRLRAASHRRALLVELGAPLLGGFAAGLAVAYLTIRLLAADFDVDPVNPPAAVLTYPAAAVATIGAAVILVAAAAALFAHGRIAHANPAEVLRDTV
jgi:putative ABC transport system permease protein